MADEPIKVFYSWQSWTSRKTNWNFIQEAIEIAIKRIKAEPEIEIVPVLDRDTQGVPGSVAIAETIFEKIDNCQIFICDVTMVTGQDSPRLIPNPNVLIELGYAANHIGWNNIICVVNEAYGTVEAMPFDLRHRRLLKYNLTEGAENKTEVKRQLANGVYTAIKVILDNIQPFAPSLTPVDNLKQLIPDSTRQIELEELLRDTAEYHHSVFTSVDFYETRKTLLSQPDSDIEKLWADCIQLYFSNCENALALFATLSWYGNTSHVQNIEYALNRWIAMPQNDEKHTQWRYIPFVLLLYTCGISAIYRKNWDLLRSAIFDTKAQNPNSFGYPRVPATKLIAEELFLRFHRSMPSRRGTALGRHIILLLRPIFIGLIPGDDDFRYIFDLFEMLFGLSYVTMDSDVLGGKWMPPHESLRSGFSWAYIIDFWKQRGRENHSWGFLDSTFLDSPNKVVETLTLFQEIQADFYGMGLGGRPDYLSAYQEGLDKSQKHSD